MNNNPQILSSKKLYLLLIDDVNFLLQRETIIMWVARTKIKSSYRDNLKVLNYIFKRYILFLLHIIYINIKKYIFQDKIKIYGFMSIFYRYLLVE